VVRSDPLGLVGQTLADKYAVESVVGAGGFATVYKARHLVWQRPVAIKVFNLLSEVKSGRQHELVESFLREGAILAELSERSPAICQARDAGTVTTPSGVTLPYLVLEWLEGSTLADLLLVEMDLGRPARSMHDAVTLLEPIAHALALAHQSGIVHRDIKPANIFVLGDAADGRSAIKLLDFGVAKVRSDAEAMASTAGSFAAFTPSYAAPEQFSRSFGATGPWTDVYAMALVLVELVTRSEAQGGEDIASVAAVACRAERRPTPRSLGAAVSDEVEAVFVRALAVDPKARNQDMGAFWSGLHEALHLTPFDAPSTSKPRGLGTGGRTAEADVTLDVPTGTPSSVGTPPARRPARPRWLVAALASAGLSTLVAMGVMTARAHPPDKNPRPPASAARAGVGSGAASAPAVLRGPACPDDMVPVPGGSFFMGDDDGTKYERPSHQVHLAPYCMDRFEVTVSAYKACSDAGECKRAGVTNAWAGIDAKQHATFDPLCNARDPEGHANHPINCVDWAMASRFCESRGKRLPSEAEWEFAARGPDGRRYPWGDEPPNASLLNACGTECEAWGKKHGEAERAMYASSDGFATTAPVGSFPKGASRYGVEDVVGNVWEWVGDWFAPYEAGPSPPAEGTERVIRGGAWNGSEPAWVRPTFRFKASPEDRSYGTGFRCARALAEP
jgi:formylglycine-generating enzyme required for sulfatase activity